MSNQKMTREQIISELRRIAQAMENNPSLDFSQKIKEIAQAASENYQAKQFQGGQV